LMHCSANRNASRMQRQLVQQQRQQEQQEKRADPSARGRELPDRQDQTRHNPVTETLQRGAFAADQ
jgi:hypothetical protein